MREFPKLHPCRHLTEEELDEIRRRFGDDAVYEIKTDPDGGVLIITQGQRLSHEQRQDYFETFVAPMIFELALLCWVRVSCVIENKNKVSLNPEILNLRPSAPSEGLFEWSSLAGNDGAS